MFNMPDADSSLPSVPESRTVSKRRTRISLVWVIPIVAAVAGVWIAVTKILNSGPEITIVFDSADGLEANKTKINYDGLIVGTLTSLRLAEDHQHVVATAEMNPKAEEFLVKDTRFWVVKPRVSGLNVTGLGTLISGYYIGVQLGQSHESERHFIALQTPPVTGNTTGRFYTLKTRELGSLAEGTPIYFRQLPAGQVVSYELDKQGDMLNVKIFVQTPYDDFVTSDTRFWQASGIDVSLNANGLHVQTESVMSILAGGIAFEAPDTDSAAAPAAADTVFKLFNDRTDAFQPPPRDPQTYLLVFNQSVRGLAVGAPVEIGGITVGEVTQINPQFDMSNMQFSVPVTIAVDPARYGIKFLSGAGGADGAIDHKKIMNVLVSRGLRAQLKTGNLLSGSLFVAVDFVPDAPPVKIDWSQTPVQLPTISGKIDVLEENLGALVKNINSTVVGAQGAITNANALLNNANALIAPDSELKAQLIETLQQGDGAARALRVLADYLERHPEALLHGKSGEPKP